MDDNRKIAGELLKIAKELVAWKQFPVDYNMNDSMNRGVVQQNMSKYVDDINTMLRMFSMDGSVCRGKMLETLKNFKSYVEANW